MVGGLGGGGVAAAAEPCGSGWRHDGGVASNLSTLWQESPCLLMDLKNA